MRFEAHDITPITNMAPQMGCHVLNSVRHARGWISLLRPGWGIRSWSRSDRRHATCTRLP